MVSGSTFSGQAVDTSSGEVLQYDSRVVRRQRVDPCGEIVDGWLVTSKQTLSRSGTSRDYDYIVATQLGGMLISEHIDQASPVQKTDFSIGQLNPSSSS